MLLFSVLVVLWSGASQAWADEDFQVTGVNADTYFSGGNPPYIIPSGNSEVYLELRASSTNAVYLGDTLLATDSLPGSSIRTYLVKKQNVGAVLWSAELNSSIAGMARTQDGGLVVVGNCRQSF